jgi:hypothetical protein
VFSLPQKSIAASALRQTATSQGVQRTDGRTKLPQPASFPQPSTPVFPQGKVAHSLLQLDLLSETKAAPKQALYAKPADQRHHGRPGYWFQFFCSFNQKQFGGLYSRTEANFILAEFQGHPWQIEPREFGVAAERAINVTNLQRGAA